ncbi:SRPBCC family protein [Rhodococcus sp. HNM0569]|uniref:SRPBCC family protein n=1 Tax=Rhodococcus sp. HNM0569 TaxID=2716340 RepID=UPI00146EB285|nr:SRPBCC family protein [Rhodococcus sp. HNM0569]
MGQVSASNSLDFDAAPERVLEALADYETVRPRILPDQYLGYKVVEGGQGNGTVVEWVLKATEKRSRNVLADVTVSSDTITETDRNSSMVTKYRVAPRGSGSVVTVTTTWNGAGGIGGFFEGLFAPIGLKKIQGSVLANLQRELS